MSGVGRETGSTISPVVNGRGSVIFVLLYIHYPPWERLDIVETPEAVCLIEKKRTLPSIRRHRLFVPVWHGDRTRSHRVRLFRLFVKGPDGDQVQRHPSRVGCGQNSHVSGGGTAFVPHLARLCSGGLSGWVKCVKRRFHYVGKCNPGRETYCSLNKNQTDIECGMKMSVLLCRRTEVWKKVWFESPPVCSFHSQTVRQASCCLCSCCWCWWWWKQWHADTRVLFMDELVSAKSARKDTNTYGTSLICIPPSGV